MKVFRKLSALIWNARLKGTFDRPYKENDPETKNKGGGDRKKTERLGKKIYTDQDSCPALDKGRDCHAGKTIIGNRCKDDEPRPENKTKRNSIGEGEQS